MENPASRLDAVRGLPYAAHELKYNVNIPPSANRPS
jgi:hypothetical protein